MMKCEECRELLFDYYDKEVEGGMKNQMEEHFKICLACRREFEQLASRLNFFKVNMPEVELADNFTQKVMQNINLAQTTGFFKRILTGAGIISAVLAIGIIISLAPIMLSLLALLGSVLVGIISTVSAVGEVFPFIQISGGIILMIMLCGVTASIRHIVLHDSFK